MYRYLLVRERTEDNTVYDTLQEAREAQQTVPMDQASGIVRVGGPTLTSAILKGMGIQYSACDQDQFRILTLE